MEVTILNPEVVRDLYKNHGRFACVCYATNEKYAPRVGKDCTHSGHMSGSRCEYIKFKISEIDRGTAEQFLRHEIGVSVPYAYQNNYAFTEIADMIADISPDQVVKNMASFRYIDKDGFAWETPAGIRKNPAALIKYNALMQHINRERRSIKALLEEGGESPSKATEDVNMVLPRATKSDFVIGFTPEAFIRLCHKRLCVRAQEFIGKCTRLMVEKVREINPDFASECVPQCEHMLWCPERGRSCGRYPTRDELQAHIVEWKRRGV